MTSDEAKPRKRRATQPAIFKAVDGMSDEARHIAGQMPNLLVDLAQRIRSLAASEIDPYLLVGVLLEGMVHTVSNCIPTDRQPDTMLATLMLLQQRMKKGVSDSTERDRCNSVPGDKD
ncbi:MAG: hypothetical protein P4L71_16940 [Acetobacteraceae bacterium]|nr:hypothetical protein [Acetobacteraceae bacterium]